MFLDSNIFINAAISSGPHGQASRSLLKKVAVGEQHAATSPLAMDEMLYIVIPKKGLPFAIKYLNNIVGNPNLQMLPVDEAVLHHLPGYLEAKLEPRDAMHAATMKASHIETICSFDHGFDGKVGIKRMEPK